MSSISSSNCCGPDKMCAITCCPCDLDVEKLKHLVNDPKFICKVCGRVANEEQHICQPVPM